MTFIDDLHNMPCIICSTFGEIQLSPTQAHHVICGRFSNRKTPDEKAIPLCEGHHQGNFDKSKVAIHRERAKWVALYGPDTLYSRPNVAQKATEARKRAKRLGIKEVRNPIPGSRGTKWKKKFGQNAVLRDDDDETLGRYF